MPSSPQPRKKVIIPPQGEKNSPCGSKKKSAQPVDLAKEKNRITELINGVSKKFSEKPKTVEKAAIVLSWWINHKK